MNVNTGNNAAGGLQMGGNFLGATGMAIPGAGGAALQVAGGATSAIGSIVDIFTRKQREEEANKKIAQAQQTSDYTNILSNQEANLRQEDQTRMDNEADPSNDPTYNDSRNLNKIQANSSGLNTNPVVRAKAGGRLSPYAKHYKTIYNIHKKQSEGEPREQHSLNSLAGNDKNVIGKKQNFITRLASRITKSKDKTRILAGGNANIEKLQRGDPGAFRPSTAPLKSERQSKDAPPQDSSLHDRILESGNQNKEKLQRGDPGAFRPSTAPLKDKNSVNLKYQDDIDHGGLLEKSFDENMSRNKSDASALGYGSQEDGVSLGDVVNDKPTSNPRLRAYQDDEDGILKLKDIDTPSPRGQRKLSDMGQSYRNLKEEKDNWQEDAKNDSSNEELFRHERDGDTPDSSPAKESLLKHIDENEPIRNSPYAKGELRNKFKKVQDKANYRKDIVDPEESAWMKKNSNDSLNSSVNRPMNFKDFGIGEDPKDFRDEFEDKDTPQGEKESQNVTLFKASQKKPDSEQSLDSKRKASIKKDAPVEDWINNDGPPQDIKKASPEIPDLMNYRPPELEKKGSALLRDFKSSQNISKVHPEVQDLINYEGPSQKKEASPLVSAYKESQSPSKVYPEGTLAERLSNVIKGNRNNQGNAPQDLINQEGDAAKNAQPQKGSENVIAYKNSQKEFDPLPESEAREIIRGKINEQGDSAQDLMSHEGPGPRRLSDFVNEAPKDNIPEEPIKEHVQPQQQEGSENVNLFKNSQNNRANKKVSFNVPVKGNKTEPVLSPTKKTVLPGYLKSGGTRTIPRVVIEPNPEYEKQQAAAEANEKARQDAIAKRAQAEERARAQQEAQARAQQEAQARAQQEAQARAQQEAQARAQQEAQARAQQEAQARAQQEAEARAKAKQERAIEQAEGQAKARAEAEAQARAQQEQPAVNAQPEEIRSPGPNINAPFEEKGAPQRGLSNLARSFSNSPSQKGVPSASEVLNSNPQGSGVSKIRPQTAPQEHDIVIPKASVQKPGVNLNNQAGAPLNQVQGNPQGIPSAKGMLNGNPQGSRASNVIPQNEVQQGQQNNNINGGNQNEEKDNSLSIAQPQKDVQNSQNNLQDPNQQNQGQLNQQQPAGNNSLLNSFRKTQDNNLLVKRNSLPVTGNTGNKTLVRSNSLPTTPAQTTPGDPDMEKHTKLMKNYLRADRYNLASQMVNHAVQGIGNAVVDPNRVNDLELMAASAQGSAQGANTQFQQDQANNARTAQMSNLANSYRRNQMGQNNNFQQQ